MSSKGPHIPHCIPWRSSTIIEEDSVFVESFLAVPDEEIESKLHLQEIFELVAGDKGKGIGVVYIAR
ncbi:hypothetical protein F4604DRAFT_1917350 [Suillus subluteus]|nr:hypothetical protein F4604DRAFT_1917350 [Suillus subluteus]